MAIPKIMQEPPDFSLVQGGPLFQLFRRLRLSGNALELLKQRVFFCIVITWFPLLVLSAIGGTLIYGQGITFLRDIANHVRFLVVLPILFISELLVHKRIRPLIKSFVERGIIRTKDIPRFNAILESGTKIRDSVILEIILVILVYTAGHWIWAHKIAQQTATWFALPQGGNLNLTLSGNWYAYVSIPIFQFILLRWYTRFFIWFWVLLRISRLPLNLLAAHPDRVGGLGFLGQSCFAFSPILFAQGALQAGTIANLVLYENVAFVSFKMTILISVSFYVLAVILPLMVFMSALAQARRDGLRQYGNLATGYVSDFNQKWFGAGSKGEPILGTADLQSLADLGNSFEVVREMRLVPFSLKDVMRLFASTLIPFAPLALTIMPLEELLKRLLNVVF
jgi:hypothetical protein